MNFKNGIAMKNLDRNAYLTCTPEVEAIIENMKREMRRATPMTEAEVEAAMAATPIRTFKKGALLLKEGQFATVSYYVFKGCIREYYLKDGEEISSEFYTEGDSLSSDVSKNQRVPAKHFWECVEDTTVSVFSHEAEKMLFIRFPRLESLCRKNGEEEFGKFRERMAFFAASSPEERYLNLLKTRPDLLDRVPQYQLASYIGVKPESLSRIRGRLRSLALV